MKSMKMIQVFSNRT